VSLNIIEKPLFGTISAYLCDGQSSIALSGPPFTHPTLPNAAHYVGSTSPKASPSHYINAIQALVHTYKLHFQTPIDCDSVTAEDRISDTIPLVVNTMGWTKGLGIELARKIEEIVNATDIFEFSNSAKLIGRTSRLSSSMPSNNKTHHLEPISPSVLSPKYTAADYRTLAILSYFFAVFPSRPGNELVQVSATSWDTSLPLCAHPPYEVDWSAALDKVILVGAGAEDVVHEEIERVLNAAVVALVACAPGAAIFDEEGHSPPQDVLPYSQGHSPPPPSSSTCHGLALIRGVSPKSTHFHLLTPLPAHLLAKCRVFVKGELELPIWGFLDHKGINGEVAGVEEGKVPYLQWGKAQGIGSERRKIRRNLMRKSQI
jgi:polynucleotide 5'-hydroxyl-kinase GRC3/NOL9